MEKFVEIEVERTESSIVFLAVDDEDERFKGLFSTDLKEKALALRGLQKKLNEAAINTLEEHDWEQDNHVSWVSCKLTGKEEALKYAVWDARKDDFYDDNSQIVSY